MAALPERDVPVDSRCAASAEASCGKAKGKHSHRLNAQPCGHTEAAQDKASSFVYIQSHKE